MSGELGRNIGLLTATRIGVSGHQSIPRQALWAVVSGIRNLIQELPCGSSLEGVTSLASGSDQIFAQEIERIDGRLYVVIPCIGYEGTFDPEGRGKFRHLMSFARTIETMPFPAPSEEAFLAAGRRVVDLSDLLIAVWDGKAARGKGGTGDVVEYAQEVGVQVEVIWPQGLRR